MGNGVTVGALADIFTRVDLVYKALDGMNLPRVLGVSGVKG